MPQLPAEALLRLGRADLLHGLRQVRAVLPRFEAPPFFLADKIRQKTAVASAVRAQRLQNFHGLDLEREIAGLAFALMCHAGVPLVAAIKKGAPLTQLPGSEAPLMYTRVPALSARAVSTTAGASCIIP